MARNLQYNSFSKHGLCFFLTLGWTVWCVTGSPAGIGESYRSESTTSDSKADALSDDPGSEWESFDGPNFDDKPWLDKSLSAFSKNRKHQSLSFGDDDYDYDDYNDNLLNDGARDEDSGNMFLSYPRKTMNIEEKHEDDDSDDDDDGLVFKQGAPRALPSYSDDFSQDDENVISKPKSFGPVRVVEDEGSEEDVIFATDEDEDDDDETSISVGAKIVTVTQMDSSEGDDDDQTFDDPDVEGVETIYNDHVFLF